MAQTEQDATFELEGMVSTLTVLRLRSTDLAALARELGAKVRTMPGFFQGAPVVFDLTELEGYEGEDPPRPLAPVSLEALVATARELGLVPVGIRAPREGRQAEAQAAGIGVLRGGPRARREAPETGGAAQSERTAQQERRSPERREAMVEAPPSLMLRHPLRGGQVVYAERCDAIAMAPVNSGAELIADGNIHVYGALRGRALAGAHGDEQARIFCQSLEADLVSIAGTYLRADEIPEQFRRQPVQIWLDGNQLRIDKLAMR